MPVPRLEEENGQKKTKKYKKESQEEGRIPWGSTLCLSNWQTALAGPWDNADWYLQTLPTRHRWLRDVNVVVLAMFIFRFVCAPKYK